MQAAQDRNADERHFAVELFGLIARVLITAFAASVMLGSVVLALTVFNQARAATGDTLPAGTAISPNDAGQGMLLFRSAQGTVSAPTLGTDVSIQVSGPLARTRVVQRFDNPGDQWQEGIYVFPLPENAAVDRLRLRIGERIIIGEIQEREQARATYQQARDNGQRAALLEQERPNLFTTSVANIGPGQRIVVEIEYQQTLPYEVIDNQGRYSLRFPMVVGPRYIPGVPDDHQPGRPARGSALDTDEVPDASRITPPVRHPDDGPINPLTLRVTLNAGAPIASLRSAYHTIHVERGTDHQRIVELADGPVPADRDFELSWTLSAGDTPSATLFAESDDTRHHALLMLMPPAAASATDANRGETALPREVIFVIDTSGSMHGDSIEQARAALSLALTRLAARDRFNVIEFNSTARALFDGARPANAEQVRQAVRWVESLEANGGTEMFEALDMALDGATHADRVRQVVFLTDGSVGNEDTLFGLIEARLGDSRLFTVGIGSAPNSYFMRKAAETGRGTFTYIGDPSEVQERMGTLFAKLESPVLKGITVRWHTGAGSNGELSADMLPQPIPDLYLGEPLVAAAALARDIDLEQTYVTVAGHTAGGVQWQSTLALRDANHGYGIGALWARRKIDALSDSLRNGAEETLVREQIIALSLAHQLVSQYTSLVAVDRTPARPADADLHSSEMATNLPAGWRHEAVFGELPRGATGSRAHLLIGLLSLLASALLWWRLRRGGLRAEA